MERLRKTGQGVGNIIRFNWHFYALALALLLGLTALRPSLSPGWAAGAGALMALVGLTTVVSLLVSFYVYDVSQLYTLNWLPDLAGTKSAQLVNIHAGFDETSALLARRFPKAALTVLDFYDPNLHTEVAIRRARAAYPPYPGTQRVTATRLPLAPGGAERVFLFMAAHEIRQPAQRAAFLGEVRRLLAPDGQAVVVEHLRDLPNFLAYTIGVLHFYSSSEWRRVFRAAGLAVAHEEKITPFVSAFTLIRDGDSR